MKQSSIELVICDMAGTTIVDKHEVEMCFTRAAWETKLKMSDEEILAVQGWAKRHVFEVYWERQIGSKNADWLANVENSYSIFRQILETHYENTAIYPTEGCLELFAFLKERQIKIALTTGFYRKVTNIILDKLGWLEGLDSAYTGNGNTIIQASIASDEVKHGRPQPDMIRKAMSQLGISNPTAVINIGDTPSDIQSGALAGCLYSCCVTNGTHTADQLIPLQPDKAFESMHAFRVWLETIVH